MIGKRFSSRGFAAYVVQCALHAQRRARLQSEQPRWKHLFSPAAQQRLELLAWHHMHITRIVALPTLQLEMLHACRSATPSSATTAAILQSLTTQPRYTMYSGSASSLEMETWSNEASGA